MTNNSVRLNCRPVPSALTFLSHQIMHSPRMVAWSWARLWLETSQLSSGVKTIAISLRSPATAFSVYRPLRSGLLEHYVDIRVNLTTEAKNPLWISF